MSWKLAELRWRHDLGLNEKSLDRHRRSGDHETVGNGSSAGIEQVRRGRSYTSPWCRVVVDKNSHPPLTTRLDLTRPGPTLSAPYSALSASSSTPILLSVQRKPIETSHRENPRLPGKDNRSFEIPQHCPQAAPSRLQVPHSVTPSVQLNSRDSGCERLKGKPS
jgi:hypothetical protein